MAKDWKDQPI